MSEEVREHLKPEIDVKSKLEGEQVSAEMAKLKSDGRICQKMQPIPDFCSVFSFENLLNAAKKCMNGVRWKSTVQNIDFRILETACMLHEKLHSGKFKFGKTRLFVLRGQRGKTRTLSSLEVKDRIVIRCFCDNFFVDAFSRRLIYDNGACLKGKGLKFSINRLKRHLHLHFKANQSNEGYVLRFDVKNFFGSIDKKKLIEMVQDKFNDKRLFDFFLDALYQESCQVGLNLGSQISQMAASYYLDHMDRMILKRSKLYGRYMDDGYVIVDSKEDANNMLDVVNNELSRVRLKLNKKKTHISKLSQQFKFLNRHVCLTACGKIVVKPDRKVVSRMRRKIRRMKRKKVSNTQISQVKASLNGYLKGF